MPAQPLTSALIQDMEVWRAATGVDATDRRALGQVQLGTAALTWQRHLEDRLRTDTPQAWTDMLADLHPEIRTDSYAAVLAHRISALHEAGVPVAEIVAAVVADGALPAEQPAAAVWWRLSRRLTLDRPTVPQLDSSTNSPYEGDMPLESPTGVRDARPVDAEPEFAAHVAEGRGVGQRPTPEATKTGANAIEAADSSQDQTRHSPGLQEPAEGRWRDWAYAVNPVLLSSEHWQAIAGELDRLDPAVVDFGRMGQYLGTRSANVVLAILRDHNDAEQADIRRGRRPSEVASSSLTANQRHERNGEHSRPSDGPRR